MSSSLSKQKLWTAIAATVALLLIGFAVYVWSSGQSGRKIAKLRSQLADQDLSTSERNALKTQLMRTVDEMDRDKMRTISSSLRDQRRAKSAQQILDFHAANESEKLAVLDEAIDQLTVERDFNAAFEGTGRRRGRRRNRGDDRGDRGGNQRERGDRAGREQQGQGGNTGEPRRRDNERRRGDEEPSDAERQQRTEFYEALITRAEERGVEINTGRDRRRR